ncbi:M23 family metallopeptidase [Rothia sp. AR01]|uniref:M23 family metallopeptidase n=1 Tax=Rothia santali TaxID=2949643 RepID=A0A9X2HCF8_9MICC|nr:M23 family metallopeptidase [Rothia santali]MCP3425715.1 M23 family metallopeptidase [Rothia santali]
MPAPAPYDGAPVVLALPVEGSWRVENSPARRVPSHGVDLFGQRYAIDLVAVDDAARTAPGRGWRAVLATEPPELFYAYGRDLLAPVDGVVVSAHEGEPDHAARRSQPALLHYALGQTSRVRRGPLAVAGNHLILRDDASGAFVALAHLRWGSLTVEPGDRVERGSRVAECGNSGNSTQPHLHLQAMDSGDFGSMRGVPFVFEEFASRERGGASRSLRREVPGEGVIVGPVVAG